MSYRPSQHIDSPPFKELAYRVLSKLTPEQRQKFSIEEQRAFLKEYSLQRFCHGERIDRLLYMMAQAGIDWTLRIHRDSTEADLLEFNVQDTHEYPLKAVDVTEATARKDVLIISSRDVMVRSHMVAQNCTTKVYHLSEYARQMREKFRDFGQLGTWEKEISSTIKAQDTYGDLLLEQLNSFEYAADTLGLEEYDIRILLSLYKRRGSAIKLSDIATLTKSKGRKMYFRKNMKKLLEQGMVTSDTKDVSKTWPSSAFFMATTKGLDAIIEYQKFVFNNTFGKM